MKIVIDVETFSTISLRDCGAAAYAAHDSTELLCAVWVDLETNKAMIHTYCTPLLPFISTLRACREFIAHNAEFERFVLIEWCEKLRRSLAAMPNSSRFAGIDDAMLRTTILNLKILNFWNCTMARGIYHGYPASLEELSIALGGPHQKDTEGQKLMRKLCAPRKPTKNDPYERYTEETHPQEFAALYRYCHSDVVATIAAHLALPPLPFFEQDVFKISLHCNFVGVPLDYFLIQFLYELASAELERRKFECINSAGISPTQTGALLSMLQGEGVNIDNLQKQTLADFIAAGRLDELSDEARGLIESREDLSKAAFKKLAAMLLYAHPAEKNRGMRARGAFRYYKAHTGRWGGSGPQFQNMPGGNGDDPTAVVKLADSIELNYRTNNINAMEFELIYGSAIQVANQLTRPCIKAPEGLVLLVIDLSQIEARVAAWVAGDTEKLEVFASGKDIYTHAAAKALNKSPAEVTSAERKVRGKVTELALGYQGWLGAFVSMASVYGVNVDESEAKQIIKTWREANPRIVACWHNFQEAFLAVACGAAQKMSVGEVHVTYVGPGVVKIDLPAGRSIYYRGVRVLNSMSSQGKPTISYKEGNREVFTYGGKLFQNICQAIARDVLAQKMVRVMATVPRGFMGDTDPYNGVELVGHVHDEAIFTLPEAKIDPLAGWITTEFTQPIVWAKGLPLGAKHYITHRYYKD